VHLVSRTPNQIMCDMSCDMTFFFFFDVTLSRILSHSVTWVSHAKNRKRYLKEKKNGKELSAGEAVHDKHPLVILWYWGVSCRSDPSLPPPWCLSLVFLCLILSPLITSSVLVLCFPVWTILDLVQTRVASCSSPLLLPCCIGPTAGLGYLVLPLAFLA